MSELEKARSQLGIPDLSEDEWEYVKACDIQVAVRSVVYAYRAGRTDGYSDGVLDGWEDGHDQGYDEAKFEHELEKSS